MMEQVWLPFETFGRIRNTIRTNKITIVNDRTIISFLQRSDIIIQCIFKHLATAQLYTTLINSMKKINLFYADQYCYKCYRNTGDAHLNYCSLSDQLSFIGCGAEEEFIRIGVPSFSAATAILWKETNKDLLEMQALIIMMDCTELGAQLRCGGSM